MSFGICVALYIMVNVPGSIMVKFSAKRREDVFLFPGCSLSISAIHVIWLSLP